MCDTPHSYVWHASFIRVTCLIHTCDMPHSYVWHAWRLPPRMCVSTAYSRIWDPSHMSVECGCFNHTSHMSVAVSTMCVRSSHPKWVLRFQTWVDPYHNRPLYKRDLIYRAYNTSAAPYEYSNHSSCMSAAVLTARRVLSNHQHCFDWPREESYPNSFDNQGSLVKLFYQRALMHGVYTTSAKSYG